MWVYCPPETSSRVWSDFHGRRQHQDLTGLQKLCVKTIEHFRESDMELIMINSQNCTKYISNVPFELKWPLSSLQQAYLKYSVLFQHGGLWLTCNSLVVRDFSEVFTKLVEHDIVTFAGTTEVTACQKGSKIVEFILEQLKKNKLSAHGHAFQSVESHVVSLAWVRIVLQTCVLRTRWRSQE